MIIGRLIALGCISMMLLSSGCDETLAKSNDEVKSVIAKNKTQKEATKEVQIRGTFKKSFEIYELDSNGVIYFVFDPKKLLIAASKNTNQEGYYKQFDACVIGDLSPKGKFGPLGRYHQQITIHKLCE